MAKAHLKSTDLTEEISPAPPKGSCVSEAVERPLLLIISLLLDNRGKQKHHVKSYNMDFTLAPQHGICSPQGELGKVFPFLFSFGCVSCLQHSRELERRPQAGWGPLN